MSTLLVDRFRSLPAALLEDSLQLDRGSLRDYEALAEHHYRAQRPATVTRVLVLRHTAATAASRMCSSGLEPIRIPTPGSRAWILACAARW